MAEAEATLLKQLQSSDSAGISRLVADHLSPLADLNKHKNKNSNEYKSLQRSLAKNYLSFLNRALSILPNRLNDTAKPLVDELMEAYRICIDSTDAVIAVCSVKPYYMPAQRVRFVGALLVWGRHADAQSEALRVLKMLKKIQLETVAVNSVEYKYLPEVEQANGDLEYAKFVGDLVWLLAKSASLSRDMDPKVYLRLLSMLSELQPWFRVFDEHTRDKVHSQLSLYLGRCILFLVQKLSSFGAILVCNFCRVTMSELAKLPAKDHLFKHARQMCGTLFSLRETSSSLISDTLLCLLDTVVDECKAELEHSGKEIVELIAYCADICQTTSTNCSGILRSNITKLVRGFNQFPPINFILRLYATGLHYLECNPMSKGGDHTCNAGAIRATFSDGRITNDLSNCLDSLGSYFQIGDSDISVISNSGVSTTQLQKDKNDYLLIYFNAFKFLCHRLAEIVHSLRKQLVTENEALLVSSELCIIQGVFHQFYDVFLSLLRCSSNRGKDVNGFDDNIHCVAEAAFILSTRTKFNMQRSVQLVDHVISSEWAQLDGLKYISLSLYNTGIWLRRSKELNEASEALKLSCKASWTRLIHLCELFVENLNVSNADLSEDSIVDSFDVSCGRSEFLLDVLDQYDNLEVNRAVKECLESWSTAVDLFGKLPGPMLLVKQWVKIQCKCYKNMDVKDTAPTLDTFLPSSNKASKRTVEIILELELLAYEQMYDVNREFCHKMQIKIIDLLLQDVYVSPDSWQQKSRILVRKARALRIHGIKGVNDCIHCLSEAISLHNQSTEYIETSVHETSPCHQLAVAYCLRALCTQEDEPQSEKVFEDIQAALDAWLGYSTTEKCPPDDKCFMVSENTMVLLYNIIDLLSLKGTYFHDDVYKILIRLLKWKNVPFDKCLARLWECRRLSHALCTSPVHDAFIMNLSDHFGEPLKSIDFWIDCLKGSRPLLIGFQHNFSFLFANFPWSHCNHESSFRSDITVDEVKEAALELISSDPVSNHSSYIAAYLYYDLSQQLISNGRLIEALSYAKEARRLRKELLTEKFAYSFKKQYERDNETGDTCMKFTIQILQVHRSVTTEVWSFDTSLSNMDFFYLSPHSVLQCYLESTLQEGVIHEIIGDGSEAEDALQLGKAISCSQSLPLFTIAFCSALGKVYGKKQLWHIAEKELQSAKQYLKEVQSAKQYLKASKKDVSCLKCRVLLEATVEQNLGDLYQSIFYFAKSTSPEKLSCAKKLYESARDKLNLSEWKNSVSCPGESILKDGEYAAAYASTNFKESKVESKDKKEAKKCGIKNARKPVAKDQGLVPEYNLRSTRSRCRSSQNQSIYHASVVEIGPSQPMKGSTSFNFSDTSSTGKFLLDLKSCEVPCDCDVACICNKMTCWHCLPMEVMDSGLVQNFVNLKWEYARRRHSLRLLTGLGDCMENLGKIDEAHGILLQRLSILVSRNPFCITTSSTSLTFLLDLMGKEVPGDVLSVERAEILHSICWLSLKTRSKDTRILFSDLSDIHVPKLVSWLLLAFVLCREVPVLFQKVCRLLAAIFLLSASSEHFSLSSSCNKLHENHWASYFHQASLGTNLHYHFLNKTSERYKAKQLAKTEGSDVAVSSMGSETQHYQRIAPESIQDLEEFVTQFFSGLPCTTIICISLLGDPYSSLIQELLCYSSCVHAWILISRLTTKSPPICMLLPVDSILGGDSADAVSSSKRKDWHCPWGSTVVDDVAPEFRLVLEGNNESFSKCSGKEDTMARRKDWWSQRTNIDRRLGIFLKNLEDSWFGTRKFVLLGEWSNSKQLDSVHKKLIRNLKTKCKMDVDDNLLKVILGGSTYAFEEDEQIEELCLKKSFCVGKVGCSEEHKCLTSPNESDDGNKLSDAAFKLVYDAVKELKALDSVNIEPTILVLDYEVQMLPWESLPMLRNQEVYRMPSVGSISITANSHNHNQDPVGSVVPAFPLIDPLDAFYLLNPSGDLSYTQKEFETWFRDKNLEGKSGYAPPAEELAMALKRHDLFMYFGHGCGQQYIRRQEIQRLGQCAATLLMGCSSGSLKLNGCYAPEGTPLSYLLAGAPVIVGNLWDVTDVDIDRFTKAMLDGLLEERSSHCTGCDQCSKKAPKKKLISNISCTHRPKVGSFMSEARNACKFQFLIGAAPVCYGVPTGIWRKE